MRLLLTILGFSAGFFVLSLAIAIIAFGADMDQLRSRSAASRAAAAVHDVLYLLHDATLRSMPHPWMIRNRWIVPVALVANSVMWGTALYAVSRMILRWRRSHVKHE